MAEISTDISTYLSQILSATYGEEVRGSIHDALNRINQVAAEAQSVAITSRTSAKKYAEDAASEWALHAPYIGSNGTWWVYDLQNENFVDTGVAANGNSTVRSVNGVNPVNGNVQLTMEDFNLGESVETDMLLASSWSNNQYSFEADYPSTDYNVRIALNELIATDEQKQAFYDAQFVGANTVNVLVCNGTVPTIDIPIIINVRSILI